MYICERRIWIAVMASHAHVSEWNCLKQQESSNGSGPKWSCFCSNDRECDLARLAKPCKNHAKTIWMGTWWWITVYDSCVIRHGSRLSGYPVGKPEASEAGHPGMEDHGAMQLYQLLWILELLWLRNQKPIFLCVVKYVLYMFTWLFFYCRIWFDPSDF